MGPIRHPPLIEPGILLDKKPFEDRKNLVSVDYSLSGHMNPSNCGLHEGLSIHDSPFLKPNGPDSIFPGVRLQNVPQGLAFFLRCIKDDLSDSSMGGPVSERNLTKLPGSFHAQNPLWVSGLLVVASGVDDPAVLVRSRRVERSALFRPGRSWRKAIFRERSGPPSERDSPDHNGEVGFWSFAQFERCFFPPCRESGQTFP